MQIRRILKLQAGLSQTRASATLRRFPANILSPPSSTYSRTHSAHKSQHSAGREKTKNRPDPSKAEIPFFPGQNTQVSLLSPRKKDRIKDNPSPSADSAAFSFARNLSGNCQILSNRNLSGNLSPKTPQKKLALQKILSARKLLPFDTDFSVPCHRLPKFRRRSSTSFFDVVPGSDTQTKERHPGQQFSQKAKKPGEKKAATKHHDITT